MPSKWVPVRIELDLHPADKALHDVSGICHILTTVSHHAATACRSALAAGACSALRSAVGYKWPPALFNRRGACAARQPYNSFVRMEQCDRFLRVPRAVSAHLP